MPCPDLRDWRRVAAAGELHTAGTTDPPGRRTAGLHSRRWGTEERQPIGINLSEKERKNVRMFETSRRGGSGAGWSGGPCGRPSGQGAARRWSRTPRETAGGHKGQYISNRKKGES